MTREPFLTYGFAPETLASLDQRIDDLLLYFPKGFPDGKGKRTQLSQANKDKFRSALINAAGYAAVFATTAPLPNRAPGVGSPPDNAVFIFIDDIVRACVECGLKPGFRYDEGSESLPVRAFIELAPLLWGPVKNPRKSFERWQRLRKTLVRRAL